MNRTNFALIFDIQLFAVEVTDVIHTGSDGSAPGTAAGGSDVSAEIKTFYTKTLIELMGPALIHDQFAQHVDIPENSGTSIEFRKFEDLSDSIEEALLGETEIPDGQQMTVVNIVSYLAEFGRYVKLSTRLNKTAIDKMDVQTMKKIAQQAAKVIDKVVREKMLETTNVMYASKVVDGVETPIKLQGQLDTNCRLKVKDVFRAAAHLKAMNAPTIDGSFVAIIHPYVANDLMMEAGNRWTDIAKYTNPDSILKGEIGTLGGVRFVQSSEAKIFRGNDLASDARTLTTSAAVTNSTAVPFSGGTVAADSLKGRYVFVGGMRSKVVSNTDKIITLEDPISATASSVIYPGEGAGDGSSAYVTFFLGANAYGSSTLGGQGIEHIMHDKGEIGGPLNQYATIGWKATKACEILVDEYLLALYSSSAEFSEAAAN